MTTHFVIYDIIPSEEPLDQIEQALREMSEKLTAAWSNNRCLACPIAELSALAAATLTFYRENKGKQDPANLPHWTTQRKEV
jgi:hypothetical protein